jgi:hypothetical protein
MSPVYLNDRRSGLNAMDKQGIIAMAYKERRKAAAG